MEEKRYVYQCIKCSRTEEIEGDKAVPLCCEKIMVKHPLDQCTVPDNPEMVRNYDEGQPCDDNRGKVNIDK